MSSESLIYGNFIATSCKKLLAKKLQDHIPALESHNSKSGTLIQERYW